MPTIRNTLLIAITIAVLTFSLNLSSCSHYKKVGNYYCSDLIDTIYGKNSLQFRKDDFSSYDIDKQYAIFICGNQYVHPPAMYLAELFAREGGRVVEFLRIKLLEANEDLTIRDLVLVFVEMSRLKTYDVASDDELMRLMTDRVEGMKDPDWKRIAEGRLIDIRKQGQK
ncbi:MAG TPA: hypothetical protein VMB77_00455 [Syntrophales bacterium]|nr:hypothetical protein [Syntrophales bacterium]